MVCAKLGGATLTLKKQKGGGQKLAPAPGGEQPALQGAVAGKKKTSGATIRDLSKGIKEKLDYSTLVDMVREIINK